LCVLGWEVTAAAGCGNEYVGYDMQDPAQTMIAVSPDVIQQLAEAEAQRYSKGEKFTDEMNTQMVCGPS
jgi:hypothetical protein